MTVFVLNTSFADQVVLIGGKAIECEIVAQSDTNVIIKIPGGSELSIPRNKIKEIVLTNAEVEIDIVSLKSSPPPG